MKVLILGATGLVGRNALAQALARSAVTQVIAPTWKPLTKQDKLMNPVAPKLELLLPEVTGWGPDAAIRADWHNDQEGRIERSLPFGGSRSAVVVGAASSPSRHTELRTRLGHRSIRRFAFFYAGVKGELERDVREIGFRSLTILRPSIIEGERDEIRLAESLVLKLSHFLAPVLPKRFLANPAPKIARVLVDAVVTAEPGCHFRYSDSLV